MNYSNVLFDLDGTIIDPREGITRSVEYALNHFGIEVADRDELLPFIGPPLRVSFRKYYGFSAADAETATEKYRERFTRAGITENTLYDGIRGLLEAVKDSGRGLYIATSKPTEHAVDILDHYGLSHLFGFIGGSEFDGTRDNKADVIRYVMETSGLDDPASTVIVGDREHDIIGAKTTGIGSVGVLYGYGSREELEAAGADHIAPDIQSLYGIIGCR